VSLPDNVAGQLRAVAELLLPRAAEIADDMVKAILETAPSLDGDPALAAELHASSRANVARWLSVQAANPGRSSPDVPPEALDLARSLVRRGVELGVLTNAYRQSQNVAWHQRMDAVLQTTPPADLPELLSASATLVFSFVDDLITGLIEQIEREKDELRGGQLARREQTIRLLLDGAPLDDAAASATLGYELNRIHTAFIVWGEPATVTARDLETAATQLAHAAGATRPLRFSASATSVWGWLGTDTEPDPSQLRATANALPEAVRAVVGASRRGTSGFRNSHDDATATHRLVAAGPPAERFAAYRDVEGIILLTDNDQRRRQFVNETLGPLAEPGPSIARTRETLRIYLQEADNSAATATRLNTHRNTVLGRIARAQELLGGPIAPRRLELSLALEVIHRLGTPHA
jgi:DNA-binding PucR family transcriptional regulator